MRQSGGQRRATAFTSRSSLREGGQCDALSTISGRFEPSAVMEQVLYRRQLVGFALTEHALAAARNEVSEAGQEGSAAAEELTAAAAAKEKAAALATAQLGSADAGRELPGKLAEKRKRGRQEQQAQQAAKKTLKKTTKP